MTTDEIVRRAGVASAAVEFAPYPEPKERKHVIPALERHLTALTDDVRLEAPIPVPN